MRKKLPAEAIFNLLDDKAIALIREIATNSGWDQPARGKRIYPAVAMIYAILIYHIKAMGSLDELSAHLTADDNARRICGFGDFAPSRSTFSRFMHFLGPQPLHDLFSQLVGHLQAEDLVKGHHIAVDSTFVVAWSSRESKDKNTPEYKLAKNCDFARLGKSPEGFEIGYRVHTATVTKSEIPLVALVLLGNVNDKKAFAMVFKAALKVLPSIKAVSADKGYSSKKNRDLIEATGVASFIRPSKTELKKKTIHDFIPGDLSEYTFWRVYWKRNAVERTFGYLKRFCNMRRPRVTNEDPIKQHMYLSFCCLLLLVIASKNMGLKQTKFSMFI